MTEQHTRLCTGIAHTNLYRISYIFFRRSKLDQECFFEDFPHPSLSVNNFTYVRRPLGLNNEAYELVRQEVRAGLETRSKKRTRSKVTVTKNVRVNLCYDVERCGQG